MLSKNKKLVIFGSGQIAEVAHYFFSSDSEYEVVAFCVDAQFKTQDTLQGLPIVTFEDIQKNYPQDEFFIFIAMSYNKVNVLRKERYQTFKEMGYKFASYISTNAICSTEDIGEHCFILEQNNIQPYAKIGKNVVLWSGNHIGHHSIVEDHCFISSHNVISGGVLIGERTFIGVNSTLRDNITVGKGAVIGAGALVLEDLPDLAVTFSEGSTLSRVPSNRLRSI
ncbi:acetyltransferase [Thalassospira profundimaris]|uniref:Transferase n=1 Tax=Thalassospira profundimaris TaxID=502049 RepID=A0A367WHS7_9PROT|nr:acetyltransferase [Thalassospira profundimaris]RCK40974.1 transferase [Thalassospira profundimaris]